MKDFLKIFFILCGFVGAFLYGRNYGEETFKRSTEYTNLTTPKSPLENIKPVAAIAEIPASFESNESVVEKSVKVAVEQKKEKIFNYKKLKSYEWILTNAQSGEDVFGNLKHVEIKDLDSYLKDAVQSYPQHQESILGSYRGRIIDVLQNEYGTLALDLSAITDNETTALKGSFKIFKDGKETSLNDFNRTQLGKHIEGSAGFIISFENRYYQLYKIPQTQQIAGFFYERLVNGTTKTIGSFVLNRVDQF